MKSSKATSGDAARSSAPLTTSWTAEIVSLG